MLAGLLAGLLAGVGIAAITKQNIELREPKPSKSDLMITVM